MINFTDDEGMIHPIPPSEAEVVSTDGDHTVYAYTNPGGRTMLSVKYNPHGGDNYVEEPDQPDINQMQFDGNMNDAEDDPIGNPAGKPLFTWKNLRLKSAIEGRKAAEGKVGVVLGLLPMIGGAGKRFLRREIPASTSIRDSLNMLSLASTEDWFAYIKNLKDSPVDLGAELSASVTPSQRIAVAKFLAEWERDPGQSSLRRKAIPGSDISELIGKGQLVYDFMTGRGLNPTRGEGYGTFQYDKMFRLAFDIISSLPINTYNSYTLFKMLDDEGENAYREAVDTYVALEIGEVSMVLEIRDKLADVGQGYANMVINDTGAAAEASTLMQKAVSAYEKGDTSRVRSILNYLQESPFYYGSPGAGARLGYQATSEEKIFAIRMDEKKAKAKGLEKYMRNGLIYISGNNHTAADTSNSSWGKSKDGKGFTPKGLQYTVHQGPFDTTPVGAIKWEDTPDKFVFLEGHTPKKENNQNKRDRQSELAEAITAKTNPPPKGRGKFFFIEIHPKSQLKMKMVTTTTSGQGDLRHGDNKSKKGQNYWMKGLYTILNDMIKEDNAKYKKGKTGKEVPSMSKAVQVGTLKTTGEEAPFMIRLPKHYFQKVSMDGVATILPKKSKANKKFIDAYQKFLDYYGQPQHSPSKSIHFRFKVPIAKRGTYYDDVRRKIGKAKRS
jgi:hypothetical protein